MICWNWGLFLGVRTRSTGEKNHQELQLQLVASTEDSATVLSSGSSTRISDSFSQVSEHKTPGFGWKFCSSFTINLFSNHVSRFLVFFSNKQHHSSLLRFILRVKYSDERRFHRSVASWLGSECRLAFNLWKWKPENIHSSHTGFEISNATAIFRTPIVEFPKTFVFFEFSV